MIYPLEEKAVAAEKRAEEVKQRNMRGQEAYKSFRARNIMELGEQDVDALMQTATPKQADYAINGLFHRLEAIDANTELEGERKEAALTEARQISKVIGIYKSRMEARGKKAFAYANAKFEAEDDAAWAEREQNYYAPQFGVGLAGDAQSMVNDANIRAKLDGKLDEDQMRRVKLAEYFAEAHDLDPTEIIDQWEVTSARMAEHYGVQGDVTDKALEAGVKKTLEGRHKKRQTAAILREEALNAVLDGDTLTRQGRWEQVKGKLGDAKEAQPVATELQQVMQREFAQDAPMARMIFERVAEKEGVQSARQSGKDSLESLQERWAALPTDRRDKVFYLLNHYAKRDGVPLAGFWESMGRSTSRGVTDFGISLGGTSEYIFGKPDHEGNYNKTLEQAAGNGGKVYVDVPEGLDEDVLKRQKLGLVLGGFAQNKKFGSNWVEVTKEEIEAMRPQIAVADSMGEWTRGIADSTKSIARVEAKMKGLMGQIEQGLYDSTASLPYMASAATGYGLVLNWAAYSDSEARKMMAENPGMDYDTARDVSNVSAVGMAMVERLQFKTLFSKAPMLEGFLGKLGKGKVYGALGTFAARAVSATGKEYVQERVQDAMSPLAQEAFSALREDIPEVSEKRWNEMTALWEPRTFFAVLPLAVLGAGGSTAMTKLGAEGMREYLASEDALRLTGLSKAAAQEIANVASSEKSGTMKAFQLFQREQESLDTKQRKENFDEAKEDGADEREILRQTREARMKKTELDKQAGRPHLVAPDEEGGQWGVAVNGEPTRFMESEQEAIMETAKLQYMEENQRGLEQQQQIQEDLTELSDEGRAFMEEDQAQQAIDLQRAEEFGQEKQQAMEEEQAQQAIDLQRAEEFGQEKQQAMEEEQAQQAIDLQRAEEFGQEKQQAMEEEQAQQAIDLQRAEEFGQETQQAEEASFDDAKRFLSTAHSNLKIHDQRDKTGSLQDFVRKGIISTDQAYRRIHAYGVASGTDVTGMMPRDFKVQGMSQIKWKGQQLELSARLYKGASALTIFEEVSESYLKGEIAQGKITMEWLEEQLREYEEQADMKILPGEGDVTESHLVEAFSDLAQAYVVANKNDASLPASLKRVFDFLREQFANIVALAAGVKRLEKDGKLNEDFRTVLRRAVGLDEEYILEQAEAEYQAELMAEVNETLTEVQDALKGKLPRPSDVAENESLRGEIERIWNALTKLDKKGRKQAQRASRYFAPKGSKIDLDRVREELNEEEGFSFATPGDMLYALEESIGGKATHAGRGFNISPNVRVTPDADAASFDTTDGRTLIGPASFAITAFHGTPHKVDKFSTEKIGTGEGAQAYGWGLYFAGERSVAEQYRINLAYDPEKMKINGRQINAEHDRIQNQANKASASGWLYSVMEGLERLMIHESPEQVIEYGKESGWEKQAIDYFRNAKFETFGSLYTVELNVDDEQLLDWDLPVSEQSEYVTQALKEAGVYTEKNEYGYPATGQFIYHQEDDSPQAKSRRLKGLGIKGIRYKDGNSRGSGYEVAVRLKGKDYVSSGERMKFSSEHEARNYASDKVAEGYDTEIIETGTHNYVIFDESDIAITHANGEAVAPRSVEQRAESMGKIPAPSFKASSNTNFSIQPASMDTIINQLERGGIEGKVKQKVMGRAAKKVREIRKRARGRIGMASIQENFQDVRSYEELLQDLGTLEAIRQMLPAEARGRIGGPVSLAKLKTHKARAKELTRRLERTEDILEGELVKLGRMDVRRLIDKSQATMDKATRFKKTKIGDVSTRIVDAAVEAMTMTAEEAERAAVNERAKLNELPGQPTLEQMEEHDGRAIAFELFAGYLQADSARLERMVEFLDGVYDEGRKGWLQELAERKQWRKNTTKRIIKALGAQEFYDPHEIRTATKDQKALKGGFNTLANFHRMLDLMEERTNDPAARAVIREMADAFRHAGNMEREIYEASREKLDAKLNEIFGIKNKMLRNKSARRASGVQQLMKKYRPAVTYLAGRSVEVLSIPIDTVEAVIRGEVSNVDGLEISDIDRAKIEREWESFLDLPESAQKRKYKQSFGNLFFERVKSKGTRQPIGETSQLDMLKEWLAVQQADLRPKYEASGFDEQFREELEAELLPETLELGKWLQDELREMTPEVDRIHREEYGLALPSIENYFPALFDTGATSDKQLSMDGNSLSTGTLKSSAFKSRVAHTARPRPANALAVSNGHMAQQAHWMAWAKLYRQYGSVLRSKQVQDAVLVTMGQEFRHNFNAWLTDFETGGQRNAMANLYPDSIFRKLGSGVALAVLGAKIKTVFLNVSSALNVLYEVDAKTLMKGFDGLRAQDVREVLELPTFKTRVGSGGSAETRYALQSSTAGGLKRSTLRRAAQLDVFPISWADALSNLTVVLAYRAEINEAMDAGLDETAAKAQAADKVDRIMARAAQPIDKMSKSLFENNLTGLAGFMFMFASEPRKHAVIMFMASRKLATGKGVQSRAMAGQQLFVGMVLYSLFGLAVQSAYKAFVKGEGDEDDALDNFADMVTDPKALAHEMITSYVRGVPLLGDFVTSMVAKVTDQPSFDSSSNPLSRMTRGLGKIDDVVTADSISESIDAMADVMQGIGGFLPEIAVFSQGANVYEDMRGFMLNSFGVAFTDEEELAHQVKKASKLIGKVYAEQLEELADIRDISADELKQLVKEDKRVKRQLSSMREDALVERLRKFLSTVSDEDKPAVMKELKDKKKVPKEVLKRLRVNSTLDKK